jgi:AhpD family alkylhydroperoxidase
MDAWWPNLASKLSTQLARLRKAQPDMLSTFGLMSQTALKANALDPKTKELIALAISAAIRCEPCITFHAKAAVKSGATDEEIAETMGVAIYMGAGPSVMYAARTLEAVEQWRAKEV